MTDTLTDQTPLTAPDTRHVVTNPAILYFGTPVVLVSTRNADGTANLAPFSSAFWLGDRAVLGASHGSQTYGNLRRTGQAVIALPSSDQADVVNRLALTTGNPSPAAYKLARGYAHVADKFARAGLTQVPAELVDAPIPAETPIALEAEVVAFHSEPGSDGAPVTELRVVRVHVHPELLLPGRPNRIDPDRWRPLIMSFQQLYGLTPRVASSRLASIDEEAYRR
ncbi:flavin reductase family protein [Microlunatus sp. GCM10028923]|uniref:flavin reductase family protein n=1 Tax=Microlunatus sp. GCM10028923 TaxID=3273400 RepID=UPI003609B14D